jgi:hypothetical protein
MSMTDDRYDLLNPPHLVTTLRSFPRRYRGALAAVPPTPEAIIERVDGHRVIDLLTDTVCTLALLDRALELTLVQDVPTVITAVADAAARIWPDDPASEIDQLLDELTGSATSLAARIDAASTNDWSRTAVVAGHGREIRAIAIARDAARTGAENLRILERIVPALRH